MCKDKSPDFDRCRLGGRWNVGPAFRINLEGDRREHAGDGSPEYIPMLRGTMRW